MQIIFWRYKANQYLSSYVILLALVDYCSTQDIQVLDYRIGSGYANISLDSSEEIHPKEMLNLESINAKKNQVLSRLWGQIFYRRFLISGMIEIGVNSVQSYEQALIHFEKSEFNSIEQCLSDLDIKSYRDGADLVNVEAPKTIIPAIEQSATVEGYQAIELGFVLPVDNLVEAITVNWHYQAWIRSIEATFRDQTISSQIYKNGNNFVINLLIVANHLPKIDVKAVLSLDAFEEYKKAEIDFEKKNDHSFAEMFNQVADWGRSLSSQDLINELEQLSFEKSKDVFSPDRVTQKIILFS